MSNVILQDTVQRMTDAAGALWEALDASQREAVRMPFEGETRTDWHYVPRVRPGVSLKEMTPTQRQLTHALLGTGLSASGHTTAQTIIGLEPILAALEGPGRNNPRDPELYWVIFFGEVGGDAPWGWRFEGHHISVNHTIVAGRYLAPAPLFFGSNPAEVRHGEQQGLRALAAEEDVARSLLHDLDGEQRAAAIVTPDAPPDILTTNVVTVTDEVGIEGLRGHQMSAGQREQLQALIDVYIGRLPDEVAEAERQRLGATDLNEACFVWAGSVERGAGHYYRVQGEGFVAEYDNTQNDANHVHAVWRDLHDDFGRQLLSRHYRHGH